MNTGSDTEFYLIINGTDTRYYYSGDGGQQSAEEIGPGKYRISADSAGVRLEAEQQVLAEGEGWRRVRTALKNTGNDTVSVELLSAAYISGIGRSLGSPWKKHRFLLHYTHTCWQGEAQWRHVFAEDAGLYKTYNHNTQSSFRLSSVSSWSTCYHEPVLIVEDTETGFSRFIRIECGHGWCINAGIRGDRDATELTVLATDCMEQNDGWRKELKPGETLTTANAVTGCVKGGFEAAAEALTRAARAAMRTVFPDNVPPFCFNDYMNALWANPNRANTLPLIEAAAKAGCDYYVIDAGWYRVNRNEEQDLGMWEVDDSIFGEGGLKYIFSRIRELGMKPGIWFELESAGADAKIVREHPEYVLRRHGFPVGGRRVLLDIRQSGVREHLMKRIRALYELGVRFIKNDYNANTGVGIDPEGALSVHEHSEAFEMFIDTVREQFPDLLLENCGSGAMRSDMGTLSHFHLQSVSDQEDYFRMPSILSGTEVCIPPERTGIWAYPYPVNFHGQAGFKPSPEFTARFADGSVTAYNCVSGLMGLMYLSGRIDCADVKNMRLISDAGKLFKRFRSNISRAFPRFPTGTFDIDTAGVDSFVLSDPASRTVLAAVWNNSDGPASLTLPLPSVIPAEAAGSVASCRIDAVYPALLGYTARIDENGLTVKLPLSRSAIFTALRY